MFDSYFDFEASSLSLSHDVRVQRIEERKEIREIEIDLIEKIMEKMKEKFVDKNNIMENENILIATMLNPRFKCDYFDEEQEEVIQRKFQ